MAVEPEAQDLVADALLLYGMDTTVLSIIMIASLVGGLAISLLAFLLHMNAAMSKARQAAAMEREASAARGRLSHPPTTSWQLRQGNRYCMFLSHFKVEAGSDARYLSDLIKRMTGCAGFLDSNDLVDLRTLFNEGESTLAS